jgi:phage terminase small subunit
MPANSAAEKLPDASHPLQNAKHERVLRAFLLDPARIGFKAYLAVYPKSSEPAAKTAFSRLLKNAEFADRLTFLDGRATDVAVQESGITIARTVAELAKIGFANVKDYIRLTADGDPAIDFSELDETKAAAIASVTVEDFKDGRGDDARDVRKISFRLFDKKGALVSILDHLGGFPAKKLADPDGRAFGSAAADKIVEKLSDLEVARRMAFALERAVRGKDKPKK